MKLKTLIAGVLAVAGFLNVCSAEKTYKISVSGGFLDDEQTTKTGLVAGDVVAATINGAKLVDKSENVVNAFANWTYTPAKADLGEGFNPFSPEVSVTMPSADVKLTANYVNSFAAYLTVECYTQGEEEEGEFYWSIDSGKTLIPFGALDGGYPVKSGKVTVKFYDKTGKWRAADVELNVDKRVSYKDEDKVTRYEDPAELLVVAKFVPVASSTKVKLDANGGKGPSEAYLANGLEYGVLDAPSRKGYVFGGYWTAKENGTRIKSDDIFCPEDFGKKAPTFYAHWLQIKKFTMTDESAKAEWTLSEEDFEEDPELYDLVLAGYSEIDPEFEGSVSMEGPGSMMVLQGAKVTVSVDASIEDAKSTKLFQKWTVTPANADFGSSFKINSAETAFTMSAADVKLQAKYVDESACGWVMASALPAVVNVGEETLPPPADVFEWSTDGKTWYKAVTTVADAEEEEEEEGEEAFDGDSAILLEKGSYTVTWRSTDPQWTPVESKTKFTLASGENKVVAMAFTYIPQVVVDAVMFDAEAGELVPCCDVDGNTVTMNPKDGLLPAGKKIAFEAKAGKDYVFQGWASAKDWEYGTAFYETAAKWEIENPKPVVCCGYSSGWSWLYDYIDLEDGKIHVVAVFKALSAYSADDIVFDKVSVGNGGAYPIDDGEVTINAVVGCEVNCALVGAPAASPLVYKLGGKLPDGLKFDTKTGVLSGTPKKAGEFALTITGSDPARNSNALKVTVSVKKFPVGLAGEYRGALASNDEAAQQNGLLEMTVKSDGKVSAKVITCYGSRSVSGNIQWTDPEIVYEDDEEDDELEAPAEFRFWHTDKDYSYCHVNFVPVVSDDPETGDEVVTSATIVGYADSFDKKEESYAGGALTGRRQDAAMFANSNFTNKYYTVAFNAATAADASGYGYLTIKTDKKGGAKVTGQLPDGEKLSMSALVLPVADDPEAEADAITAELYLFASPKSYNKQDWFAMTLVFNPDGTLLPQAGAWTIADVKPVPACCGEEDVEGENAVVAGLGSQYSEAKTLENYYWAASCAYSDKVQQQYSYKNIEETYDGKTVTTTEYENAEARDFDGFFFSVGLMGNKGGLIGLNGKKSPAPWEETIKEDGKIVDKVWNYEVDKKGNEITDPSQLSISFTKATGIFTGTANVYFDCELPNYKQNSKTKEIEVTYTKQHKAEKLPYAGVMIADPVENEDDPIVYTGLGSAVYTYKYSYEEEDDKGKIKTKTATEKISLPVALEPTEPEE